MATLLFSAHLSLFGINCVVLRDLNSGKSLGLTHELEALAAIEQSLGSIKLAV